MKYLVIVNKLDNWLDMDATAQKILEAWQTSGDPPEVVWAEAYAELAMVCQFRLARVQQEELAHTADILGGGILFAARLAGFPMPDDWQAAGGGADALRRVVWGSLAEKRIQELEAKSEALSGVDPIELLERFAMELRVIGRRAALKIVKGGKQ